mgnify:CR=1 FL=1
MGYVKKKKVNKDELIKCINRENQSLVKITNMMEYRKKQENIEKEIGENRMQNGEMI